ncbi:WD40 repeat domain-containing protein [Nostoc sp.]|uniref:WD40 repeat domain-containing protein n=1 Tax=Nostoc sp. TaxID=1180 RepID=UPI002FFCC9FA
MTVNDAVLGGIERVKQLLAYGRVEQKIDALLDAFEYGEAGLDLIIQALQNSEVDVQEAAYWLLQESTEPKTKLALQLYNPYLFFEYLFTIERYTDEVRSIACVDISQELQTLVICNYDNIIQVWNMQTKRVIYTFQPEATKEFDQIAIAPNNRVLGLWHCLDLAEVWDLKIGQKIFTTNIQSEEFWGVSFSPDGQTLVSTRDGYKLTFWDINEQKIIPSIFIPENIHRRIPIY